MSGVTRRTERWQNKCSPSQAKATLDWISPTGYANADVIVVQKVLVARQPSPLLAAAVSPVGSSQS